MIICIIDTIRVHSYLVEVGRFSLHRTSCPSKALLRTNVIKNNTKNIAKNNILMLFPGKSSVSILKQNPGSCFFKCQNALFYFDWFIHKMFVMVCKGLVLPRKSKIDTPNIFIVVWILCVCACVCVCVCVCVFMCV